MKTTSTGNDPSWLQLRFVSKWRIYRKEGTQTGLQWENDYNWGSQVLRSPVWQTNEVPRLPMRFPTCLRAAAVFFSRLFQHSSANDGAPVTPIAAFLKDIVDSDLVWEKTFYSIIYKSDPIWGTLGLMWWSQKCLNDIPIFPHSPQFDVNVIYSTSTWFPETSRNPSQLGNPTARCEQVQQCQNFLLHRTSASLPCSEPLERQV